MEYIPDKREIVLNRELSKLDRFVLKFVHVLKKHMRYVIMSGYVSIILGRSRATEDIGLFLEKIDKARFIELYNNLYNNGFWCLNTSNIDEMFDYLERGFAIRFAEKHKAIPNFEIKFPKCSLDRETFNDAINVKTSEGEVLISSLERHIAFKRVYLGSDKDKEDALHIQEVFKDRLNMEKIKQVEERIKNEKD